MTVSPQDEPARRQKDAWRMNSICAFVDRMAGYSLLLARRMKKAAKLMLGG
jgi:hypothetical protein